MKLYLSNFTREKGEKHDTLVFDLSPAFPIPEKAKVSFSESASFGMVVVEEGKARNLFVSADRALFFHQVGSLAIAPKAEKILLRVAPSASALLCVEG